jgi:hypothetical protein
MANLNTHMLPMDELMQMQRSGAETDVARGLSGDNAIVGGSLAGLARADAATLSNPSP